MIPVTLSWIWSNLLSFWHTISDLSMQIIDWFNPIAWVVTNVLILYIGAVLIVFTVGYYILFNPKLTTAGRYIFRFALSLVGVIGLTVISLFINPSADRSWFTYPGDVADWRPILRLVVYSYVAFTITALAILLGVRKWRPDLLRTSRDRDLVRPRTSDYELPISSAPQP